MSADDNKPGGMTDEQRAQALKELYQGKGPIRPVPPPSDPDKDPNKLGATTLAQWRFGVALVVLGCFILLSFLVFPDDDRRWPFFGFSFLTVAVGGWCIERANKRLRKTQ